MAKNLQVVVAEITKREENAELYSTILPYHGSWSKQELLAVDDWTIWTNHSNKAASSPYSLVGKNGFCFTEKPEQEKQRKREREREESCKVY